MASLSTKVSWDVAQARAIQGAASAGSLSKTMTKRFIGEGLQVRDAAIITPRSWPESILASGFLDGNAEPAPLLHGVAGMRRTWERRVRERPCLHRFPPRVPPNR